jgi:DNA (cytosine-5)-methyltransferase 1
MGETVKRLGVGMLTVGSLFSGIGGLDLGLERAGMQITWQCEIDDYASKVLAKHWPDVPRFRDVRDCGAHNLAPVDLICGGFPCQGISDAGKRAGLADPRSGLWAEYARIVGELRPRYVLVENVAALLGRGLGTVLGDLAACGYDAEWQCLPAAAVGAPHIRDRVFVVAYWSAPATARAGYNGLLADAPRSREWADQNQSPRSAQPRNRADTQRGGTAMADAIGERLQRIFPPRSAAAATLRSGGAWWTVEPAVGRMVDGVPPRLVRDPLRAYGNAVVPQIAEWIGRQIVTYANAA